MSRLIDADKLMLSLNDNYLANSPTGNETLEIKDYRESMCEGLEIAMATVEGAPTVNGWISVKDKLPETNNEVLTTYLYDDEPSKRYIEPASYFDDGEGKGHWHSIGDECTIGCVRKTTIAWMPMPKPYKPSKEK